MGGCAGTPVVLRCAGLALIFAVVCILELPGGAQQGPPAPPSNVRIVVDPSDTTAPVITAVTAGAVTASGATMTWTTDEPADSQVQYGISTSYGSQSPLDTTRVQAHSVALTGLLSNTLYHFRVRSRDVAGNLAVSGDFTFRTAAGDLTPPTVSVTAPVGGATVSGTVSVTATASDNVGVTGVQFRLDGANLGAEDTTVPYSVSWNTTSTANGTHTLTAIARDAAGNQATSAGVTVAVSNGSGSTGIAALFPGDAGIESHPDVIFTEMFEQSSISNMTSRYTDVNHAAGMSFNTGVPAGSGGSRSLQMTTNGGANEAAGLFKTFANDQQWYLRYYVNYTSAVEYGHTSIWLGGYNPPLTFPNPQAGNKPAGDDRFSIGIEPLSFDGDRWMSYTYWKDMRISSDGRYWGNVMLPGNANLRMQRNRWYCVETMVKLNSPVTDTNGELAIWIDGQKILHLGKGFPNGTWNAGTFTEGGGSSFAGFQWRSDPALGLNWIWLQNYVTGVPSSVQFDHVVLARNYVGCLASGSVPDTVAPTVAMSAPAAGAIVSGSAVTVSATASDNVGVAGVQFKLDGVNLGAEDTSSPYSIVWNMTAGTNGSHTLTAVARDAAGNVTTSAGRSVTVSNLVTPAWPNEPAGFVVLSDQPWDLLTGLGWNYLRRTASKNSDIAIDPAAPLSPASVLRIIFTTSMAPDSEPGVHWIGLSPRPSELYMGWWMKVSPNWTCSPAGCGKITFAWAPDGEGQVYSNLGGSSAPHRININTEWAPYGQRFWEPNVTTTPIVYNTWYRIEWYLKYASSTSAADGVMRWWVNGVLNGDYANVRYPGCCFQQFEFAPTLQNPPPAEQYMYIDHTRVSKP